MLKTLQLPSRLQGRILKGKLKGRAAGCMTFFWLVGNEVIGWWSRNPNQQPSGSNQSEVYMLVLSLKLPSFTWVRALLPVKELKKSIRLLCISFKEELMQFKCAFWNSGKVFEQETKGTKKCFCSQKDPTGSCSISISSFLWISTFLNRYGARKEK